MNSRFLLLAAGMAAMTAGRTAVLDFPAGTFESGWISSTTGLGTATNPLVSGERIGRVSTLLTGSGTLISPLGEDFVPNSLYVFSIDVRSASLLDLTSRFLRIEILDGDGNVIVSRDEEGMVGLLGGDLTAVSSLTPDISGLAGNEALIGDLLILLSATRNDPAFLSASQAVVDNLEGTGAALDAAHLLQDVADGVQSAVSLNATIVGEALSMDPSNPLVPSILDLVALSAGNLAGTAAVASTVFALSETPSEIPTVSSLLEGLLDQAAFIPDVSNLLLLALSDPNVLVGLADQTAQSLLGILDPTNNGFQTIRMILPVGDVVPPGGFQVRLSAGTIASVGLTVDFDNVTIDQLALNLPVLGEVTAGGGVGDGGIDVDVDVDNGVIDVDIGGTIGDPTPTPTPEAPDPTPEADPPFTDISVTNALRHRPGLSINGRKQIRDAKSRVKIRGRAWALGANNAIRSVEYKVRAPGESRRFRQARGRELWKFVLHPDQGRMRVLVRARDLLNQRSPRQKVMIIR